jgi:hypothetical protein
MSNRGKYAALSDLLKKQELPEVAISLAEIEAAIGFSLPTSAKLYPAWWSNQTPQSPQCRAWMSIGWNAYPRLKAATVTFRKTGSASEPNGDRLTRETSKILAPEFHLQEDSIKEFLRTHLEAREWKVAIVQGGAHGIDIDAKRGEERWIIEVKGCGSLNPMRVNYFLGALGELLQRMNDPEARYSIAVPDLPQFRGLWNRLPSLAKQKTGISCLFVRADGNVEEVS